MSRRKRIGRILVRFKSIRTEIFAVTAGLLLLAAGALTVVSVYYMDTTAFETSQEFSEKIIHQVNESIDSYITYMDNITSMIANSTDAQAVLFGANADGGYRARLGEQFQTILRSRSDIRNIGVIRKDSSYLINVAVKKVNPYLELDSQNWYTEALDGNGSFVLTSSHVQALLRGERPWVITLSRGVRNYTGGGGIDGVAFVDLNYSVISELCEENSIGRKGYVFVIDQAGEIVYHPQQQQLFNDLRTEKIDAILSAEDDANAIVVGNGDDRKLYTIARSDVTGWTVVGSSDVSALLQNTRRSQRVYLIITLILVIVALVVSGILAASITRPVQRLKDSMAKVQEGDFSGGKLQADPGTEIGSLTESFNVMTERIQDLMAQNRIEQEEKRKSELRALQSQINPHFLYNTLDSIIWMAESKKSDEVVLMTSSLARLLRQSITSEDELVTVSSELEHARSYLTIQQMRYKDKLSYTIDAQPDILTVRIIRLILQPLIENSIYHGIKYKETPGHIAIRAYAEKGQLILEIRDDGIGMDEEALKHIFERHKVNYQSNGVGVYNVQQRIQLYYGPEYGIRYQSSPGKGTLARIQLPTMEPEDNGR